MQEKESIDKQKQLLEEALEGWRGTWIKLTMYVSLDSECLHPARFSFLIDRPVMSDSNPLCGNL